MQVRLLPRIITMIVLSYGTHMCVAADLDIFRPTKRVPPFPLAFTEGVITGAILAPSTIMRAQVKGIHPFATYFGLITASSLCACVLARPYKKFYDDYGAIADFMLLSIAQTDDNAAARTEFKNAYIALRENMKIYADFSVHETTCNNRYAQLVPTLPLAMRGYITRALHNSFAWHASKLLKKQSFAQGFAIGAALSPFMLCLKMP